MAANKLCNSYTAFNTNYHDTGLFGIIATAEANAPHDDLAWAIMHEVGSTLVCSPSLPIPHSLTSLVPLAQRPPFHPPAPPIAPSHRQAWRGRHAPNVFS